MGEWECLADHPEIVLETTVESGLTDIVADRYDAGLSPRQPGGARHDRRARPMICTIGWSRRRIMLARHGRPQIPADLHAHNCIRYRLPGGGFIPWLFVADGKPIEFDVAGSLIVINDPELVINAALQGVGIAYLYEEYVARMIADGRLVSLLDKSVLPVTKGFFQSIRAGGRIRLHFER